jgi:hypothetical protein
MAQSTWAADTNTWAADTNTWAVSTYQHTALLNANSSVSSSQTAAFPVTANMTQLNLTELNEEDAIKLASATLGASVGTTASASVSYPVSITLSDTQTIKNNVNFEESISLGATSNATSDNNFLWNDITEDTTSTWTKVADPDE